MQQGGGSDKEVTWEDQQNINKFGRLNNRLHELEDEIKIAKEGLCKCCLVYLEMDDLEYVNLSEDCIKLLGLFLPMLSMGTEVKTKPVKDFEELHHLADLEQSLSGSETNDNLEDASNELILTDEEVVRFQIGEVLAHVPRDEVETRIEQMKEVTGKNMEKLDEEKESVVAQMAKLKKILYGKFGDSINLEEN
ncbi:hypothetical protein POTOM_045160 [Populus tomentosa]|uniref:Prefoldin subunit 4 n=1 Tax=Populus tomentosa TaxID=118781 RepID=A0A8X8CDW8_POPTO|nr:hypothetical protein POTOM_045160 [Populus tomentosa]